MKSAKERSSRNRGAQQLERTKSNLSKYSNAQLPDPTNQAPLIDSESSAESDESSMIEEDIPVPILVPKPKGFEEKKSVEIKRKPTL